MRGEVCLDRADLVIDEMTGGKGRGAKVFRISACLFLGIVGIKVRPFCFQDANRAAFSSEYIIGAPALAVQFKTNAALVQEVPAAVFERLVDRDAGECLGFGHDGKCEYNASGQRKCIVACY